MNSAKQVRRGVRLAGLALVVFVLSAAGLLMRPSAVTNLAGAVFTTEGLAGEVQLDLGHGFFPFAQPAIPPAQGPIEVDGARACPAGLQAEAAGASGQALRVVPLQGEAGAQLVEVPAGATGVTVRPTPDEAVSLARPDQGGETALLLRSGPEGGCFAQWARTSFPLDGTQLALGQLDAVRLLLTDSASDGAAEARLAVWSRDAAVIASPSVAATQLTFPVDAPAGPDPDFTRAVKVVAAAMIALAFALLGLWVLAVRDARSTPRPARRPIGGAAVLSGVAATGYLLFWLVVTWPGLIAWDASVAIEAHLRGDHTGWYGWFYPALLSAALELGSIAWLTVLNWLLHILVVWLVVLFFGRAGRGYVAAAALLAALLFTAIGPSSAYVLRDALNGVVLALLALVTFRLCTRDEARNPAFDPFWTAVYAVLIACALLLRVDNVVFVLPLLALFLWRGVTGWKSRIAAGALALAVALAFPAVAKRTLTSIPVAELDRLALLYGTSAYVNGAGAVMASDRFDYGHHAHSVAAVHRIVDYGIVAREWRPDYIHYWHAYHRPPAEMTRGDVERLRNAFVRLALAYPKEFLKGRLFTFAGTMGGMPSIPLRITKLEVFHLFDLPERAHRLAIDAPGTGPIEARADRYLLAAMDRWSSWPGLVIALVVSLAALAQGAPVALAVALAALLRAGVFFLFEPLDVFFYLYELQFLTFLLPLLFWAEFRGGATLAMRSMLGHASAAARGAILCSTATRLAALAVLGALLVVAGLGVRTLMRPATADSPIDRDAAELVGFLDALETRVATLSAQGCRLEELGFENPIYTDNSGGALHTRERFAHSAARCQVFANGALDARVAPSLAQIPAPHPGGLRTGMLEFTLRAVPGLGSDAPDLVALVTHVNPLICAFADRHSGRPGVSGRIFFMDWALRPFDGSSQASPLPFSDAAKGLEQFCFRDTHQTGREGEQHTHLARVLLAR
jgi:hypothetical protein